MTPKISKPKSSNDDWLDYSAPPPPSENPRVDYEPKVILWLPNGNPLKRKVGY